MNEEPQLPPEWTPEPEPAPPNPPEPLPVWGFADLALFAGLATPCFLVGMFGAFGALSFLGVGSRDLRALVAQFVGYAVALAPLWLVFGKRFGRSAMEVLRMPVPAGLGPRSLLVGAGTSFAILALSVVLRMPKINTPLEKMLEDPAILATAAVLGVTVGPWFEELLFRGLLQPVLVRFGGVVAGILFASLPFALLHGPQYSWSWRHVLLLTLAGCAFGWWRERTGSTGAAILMHAGYNLVLFTGYIAAKWGGTKFPQTF